MHARENARSSEYASGRRVGPDESLVRAREGPRRKEPPVKERRERVLPEVVVNAKVEVEEEAGPLGRLVRASVGREREKSRTRLVPRDGSWLLVADARRPLRPLAEEAGSRYRSRGEWVLPALRSPRMSARGAARPRRAFKWKRKVLNAPIKAAIGEALCVRPYYKLWRESTEICFMLEQPPDID